MNSEEQQVMLEFMDIVGESTFQARQFLEATGWILEEAVQLYFAESNNELNGTNAELPTSASNRIFEEDENYIRPPMPMIREALYEDGGHHIQYPGYSSVAPFRNFEDAGALYAPPLDYMFQGTFEHAKIEAARQGKWLLVNLQSNTEFASYTLNRDTWGYEAVKAVVDTSFVLWQVNDDTEEGMKVCNYYKVTMIPSILVIDSTTGEKMRSWNGMVDVERLLEDLEWYIDHGPLENHPIRHERSHGSAEDVMLVDVGDEELSAA